MKTISALAAALLICQAALGAECITIGSDGRQIPWTPPPPPPVLRVTGAFCGTAHDALGPFENAELDLIGEADLNIVAKVPTDAKGGFIFSRLPLGRYRAYVPGWTPSEEVIEITSANQRHCQRPLFVSLTISGECPRPSHIAQWRQPLRSPEPSASGWTAPPRAPARPARAA